MPSPLVALIMGVRPAVVNSYGVSPIPTRLSPNPRFEMIFRCTSDVPGGDRDPDAGHVEAQEAAAQARVGGAFAEPVEPLMQCASFDANPLRRVAADERGPH